MDLCEMAELPKDPNRRRVDRRQNGDRRTLWRGVDRRRGDRRLASAAAGLMVAACLAAPRPAQAQVYSWHDAKGTLVLSNRIDSSATRYERLETRATPIQPKPASVMTPRRAAEYDGFIDEQAATHGVRAGLVRGVIQAESNFNPRARSSKGAMGLMQLMSETAADLGVLDPFDALDNIRGGVAYLRQLLNRYHNNEALALAAYNAGPGAVDRHGSQVPPYRETQDYVKRILGSTLFDGKAAALASAKMIYKTTRMIDGFAIPHYSSSKPADGPYEVIKLH
jgi:soluble lytic murein transglycosylase-like protein